MRFQKFFGSMLVVVVLILLGVLTTAAADPPNLYYPKYYGECTWYAADRRVDLRFNRGYAYEWVADSQKAGFPVDTTPQVGDIAVWQPGNGDASNCCGHVGYVIAVLDSPNFRVAEYNWDKYHEYDERDVKWVEGIQFIHGKSNQPVTPAPLPDPQMAYVVSFNPTTARVGARVTITVGATDTAGNRNVSAIQVSVDGNAIVAVSGASGSVNWNTNGLDAGAHTIQLRAQLQNWSSNVNTHQANYFLQSPEAAAPSAGGPDPWDVSWIPGDRARVIAAINTIITSSETGGSANAGLKGYGETILNYSLASVEGNPAGVNPAFALAMFRKEANFATYGAAAANKNPGNIICAGGKPLYGANSCAGRFGVYASMDAGIRAYFWLLQAEYKPGGAISRNCPDIPCIIRAYAPSSENNTNLYISQVSDWTRDFQNRISNGAPPPPPPPPPPPITTPDKPTLASPNDGASMSSSAEVILRWNAARNATQYKIEVWGGQYNRMTPCDWQGDTSCRIGTMWPGTMSWRVRARNANGQESDWSDTWSFTIQDTPKPITFTPTPTSTPTPTIAAPGNLQVIGDLYLSNTSSTVGERVTASFRVRNTGGQAVFIKRMDVGARGPNARSLNWNAPEVDFPAITDLTLQPGGEYQYRAERTFDTPGDYFAEPVWMDASNHWEGIAPFPRVWFNVAARAVTLTPTRTPTMPAQPGRLVLIEDLRVSNSNPQLNQAVNARYRVRNAGGQPIFLRYLGVKGRHSSGASYDFYWYENMTMQPGQEFTYDANRAFDRAGAYSLTPNYSFDGANWDDVHWSDGRTSYVTINVSQPQPPTLTPTPPGPSGNLAPRARREPDGINSGYAFDGNLSSFWTNGLGHQFNLRLTWQDAATINRILVWDRPQNSPDNQQINALIISLSNGWSKRFDMNSGGPRCIDVTLASGQRLTWVNLKADDASGNNGLSEVEIWAGNKTSGPSCSNRSSMP